MSPESKPFALSSEYSFSVILDVRSFTEYSNRFDLVERRYESSLEDKSSSLIETPRSIGGRFAGDLGTLDTSTSVVSLVVLEGDFRAGNLDAGFLLGDFRAGDLRPDERERAGGGVFPDGGGELFRVLAGERVGDTPLRVLGGLTSKTLALIRPLLVDILSQYSIHLYTTPSNP